ncbi:hypothetical protein GQ53DRAFT_803420 [Thozetella sp. PMI_491]|nr:hypothetical protein GQ53DRAFT_803420 [Thozetella sp. PMI_491]
MGLSTRLSTWRATAVINTAITSCLLVLMLVLLGFCIGKSGAVNSAFIFYQGPCDAASRLNTVLHLVINILSTGVLTSSNYFMKVLLSPTRREIDRAHRCGHWLDIGTISTRNFRAVSTSKKLLWAFFVISSLPIHLFLNSVIFMTSYLGSDFNYTIASEAFVNNGSYYLPGASLPGPPITKAIDATSNLTDIIQRASSSAKEWQQLSPEDCRLAHFSCSGRKWFQDVVVVVDTGNQNSTDGWIPATVYRDVKDSASLSDRTNSLWNSSHCSMHTNVKSLGKCASSCEPMTISEGRSMDDSWTIHFYHNSSAPAPDGLDMGYNELQVRYCMSEIGTCKVGASNLILLTTTICVLLNVILCLLSLWDLRVHNPLITLGDAIESFLVYPELVIRRIESTREHVKQRGSAAKDLPEALYCPKPQKHTTGWSSTKSLRELYYKVSKGRSRTTSCPRIALDGVLQPPEVLCNYSPLAAPAGDFDYSNVVAWKRKRYLSFDETSTPGGWLIIWILFLLTETVIGNLAFMDVDKTSAKSMDTPRDGGFGDFEQTPLHSWLSGSQHGFLGSILLANIPQVLISLIYVQYTTSVTRTAVAEEWAHFSISPRPLRVTNPAGDQVSPYFFDMPCKYAIPLTALSIFFHWLVSQAIYMVISEGDGVETPELGQAYIFSSEILQRSSSSCKEN